jgi:iron complex outermembrane recepter protein
LVQFAQREGRTSTLFTGLKSTMRTHPFGEHRCALTLLTLGALTAASAAFAQTGPTPAASPDADDPKPPTVAPVREDEVIKAERFEVVGSRVRRLDAETVSPVVQMKFDEIRNAGFTNVGDALRALPFNSGQALTPTDSGNSFTPGISTINIRGLGNNSTLVLINGRRAVPYAAPGFNGLQTMFDLNSIPQAAIDRVEILKDGGSALYGSDAVGGVVDFKLRDTFDGANVTLEFGNYLDTDGLHKEMSIVTGAEAGRTRIIVTADWRERNAVFARDLDYVRDADFSARATAANPHYSAEGWAEAGFASEAEYLADIEAFDPVADGNFDLRSSRGFPGYVRYDVNGNGTISNATERFTFKAPTDAPTSAGAVNGVNLYNFNETNGTFPEQRAYSFYTRARHDFTDSLYGFAEVSFTRSRAISYAAAAPVDIETENGLSTGSPMFLPAYNPFNPFGVDIFDGRRRIVEIPNRINDVTADTPRILAGLGGDLPVLEGWTWEAAALYTKNSVTNLQGGMIADYRMQQALQGLTRLADGKLTWDPATPQSQRVYFNWFGLNSPEMARFLTVVDPQTAEIEYKSYDVSARGSLFDLPGGPVGVAIGAERRQEDFSNIRSDLAATGNLTGGGEGTSSIGDRSVTSFYAEAAIPVLKSLELLLAARYEDYSDEGFKDEARPKIGFKYRPFTWLVLRGSYSESFKAPDLAYLYTGSQTVFSSFQVNDPITGTRIDQIQIVSAGNLDLGPETTDTYFAGISIEPRGRLRGLQISADWFEFKQENLLAQLSDFYGYQEFLSKGAAGDPLFAGKVVRDPATNEVLFIRDDYVNISTSTYRGMDFAVSYDFNTTNWGRFHAGVSATWIDSLQLDEDELVGSYLTAEWNGNATLSWARSDWGANIHGVYRGRRHRDISFGSIFDEGDELFLSYTVKQQTTWNVSVSYSGLWDTTIRVGVNNVFDKEPPVDPYDPLGTTAGINDPEPAFAYVRFEKTF